MKNACRSNGFSRRWSKTAQFFASNGRESGAMPQFSGFSAMNPGFWRFPLAVIHGLATHLHSTYSAIFAHPQAEEAGWTGVMANKNPQTWRFTTKS
jgi:hypothetical protein